MSDLKDPTPSQEDERFLELLDQLGPDSTTADRESLEAVAALPYELDELAPRAEVKRALMESVSEEAASEPPESAPVPFVDPDADSRRLAHLERRSRWYMPIAAALAVALIGLAGWQFRQLEDQRQTIAALSTQLESVERDGAELELARHRLNEMQSQLRLLTASGSEFCVLKPYGDEPTQPQATATMVLSSDRNRWFLAAEGLEPCAKGRTYQLWFITDGEPIRAAVFDGEASGGRLELSGTHEGVPTSVRAVTVTLETEPEPAEPSAPILFADEAMTLL